VVCGSVLHQVGLRGHRESLLQGSTDLVLEEHVISRLEADASLHDVLDTGSLFKQGVYYWSSSGNKGSFEQVAEDGEDRVESSGLGLRVQLYRDSLTELRQDDEVENERLARRESSQVL